MKSRESSGEKNSSGFTAGIVFIAVGVAMLRTSPGGGIAFLILGAMFLLGALAARRGKEENRPSGGFPSAPVIREHQAEAERRLREDALAPDGKRAEPSPSAAPARVRRDSRKDVFSVRMTANEIDRRREELKGLLESGIISREEYRDRVKNLR